MGPGLPWLMVICGPTARMTEERVLAAAEVAAAGQAGSPHGT